MPIGTIKQTEVDVLIVGAGPAGLMACNALANAGIIVRIVDQRPVKVSAGQADGIQPRTIEVLQSYGLAERLLKEANQMHTAVFYNPNPQTGGIELTDRCPDVSETSTPYPFEATLHQGAIEEIFLDSIRRIGVKVSRPVAPISIQIVKEEQHPILHPVRIILRHLNNDEEQADTEVVYAKYVIGADGAHSWVRKSFNIAMEGEQTDYVWGVVDMVPDTDFPDIRNHCAIHSTHGSCMIIPREGDVVRLYIQLDSKEMLDATGRRIDKNKIGPHALLEAARRSLSPFSIKTPEKFDWWTIYVVGQRVASKFSVDDRVFIAGDACHTHSPKAGQGMNASMNDSHNLAWKLVHVIRGWADSSLLTTYEDERRKYAQDLIDFDKKYARLYSGKPWTPENPEGISHEEFVEVYQRFGGFASGIGIHYSPSSIVNPVHQSHAKNLTIGKRVPSQILIRATDSRPFELQELLPSDGRFKVLVFAGDTSHASQRTKVAALATEMNATDGFLQSYSPLGNILAAFDIIAISSAQNAIVRPTDMPELFRSHWSKVFVDQREARGNRGGYAYAVFGVDPEGAVVIVRPDGYVGMIAPFDQVRDINHYFASFTKHV